MLYNTANLPSYSTNRNLDNDKKSSIFGLFGVFFARAQKYLGRKFKFKAYKDLDFNLKKKNCSKY